MFDEETRVAIGANTTGFGDAFAGRGESINTAIGAFRPLLRDIVPVAQNLASPETNLRRFFGELGDAAAIVAPAAEAQAELFVNLDTTFARAARGVAALHPGLDHRRRARARHRDRDAADPAAVPAQHRGPVPRAPAGRRRAAPVRADDRRRARGGHPHAAAHAAVQPPARVAARRAADFAEDPQVPRGLHATTATLESLDPDAGVHHPGPDRLQLPDAVVPQRLVAAQRRRPQRHLAALHHRRHAAGPEQRGRAGVRARRTGRPRRTTSTPTRIRTRPRPGQPRECEAGNEPYARGRTVLANVPGTQQARTEGNP